MMNTKRSKTLCSISTNLLCLLLLCLLALLPLCGAAPVTVPEEVDRVPVPASDDNTMSDSKDDSSIKLDLSGLLLDELNILASDITQNSTNTRKNFTDAELARLAGVLQKELEEHSPASFSPRIEFSPALSTAVPIWVVPVDQPEEDEYFPRDRRSLLDEEDDNLTLGDQENSPISLYVVEENPKITSDEELMSSALTAEEVDEIELSQRLGELGDFLRQRAWTTA